MEIIGRFVDRDDYVKYLERHGFKYSPITKSMFLSYPYVPKEFANQAVRVLLDNVGFSSAAKIDSLEYYVGGSPYKKTESPKKDFREYVEKILEGGVGMAHPKNFLA
jgi:hypothetical protein